MLASDVLSAQFESAFTLHQQGKLDGAEALYREILCLDPYHFDALQLLATIALQKKNFAEALRLFDQVLTIDHHQPCILNNRGLALKELKRYEEALLCFDKAIAEKHDYAEAYLNRGVLSAEIKHFEEALSWYDRAIAVKPDYAEAYFNRGNALKELKCYEDALLSYEKATVTKVDYTDAYLTWGALLGERNQFEAALRVYKKFIAINPDYAGVHADCGVLYMKLKQYENALHCYDRAFAINPEADYLFGERVRSRIQICDWTTFDSDLNLLLQKIYGHAKSSIPFPVIALVDSLFLQKQVALTFVEDKFPSTYSLPEIDKLVIQDKICIGYFSADFHDHATAYLMAELFEHHDRSRFELIAFSFGPDQHNDSMRKRVVSAFDRFIDVRNYSDEEVALLSRELGVAIAVDLKGFTTNCRTGIFALRAAPIQVNYLGYPGTMGASYIDYLIADHILIPEESRQFYTEKIAYLPNSYQVNDRTRQISDRVFTREEFGLPKTGFVFCCFNNNYKITPSTFDGWMRLLKQVEGSVLWLLEDNAKAAEHLRREAVRRGVLSERLIFAKRMVLPDHLARHRLADLFLDTSPYNAHTTASDALWAGLPVLTCIGESFASRVAASLLNAIHLPELITSTQAEYEALALELATNPKKLNTIKHKLEKNRLTTPLFDTGLFTGDIEKVYMAMYERYLADLPPEHILSPINKNS